MPQDWWTRKSLIYVATVIVLAFMGFIVIGVSHPEPAASAALPLLALQSAGLRLHDLQPVQGQPVDGCAACQNPGVRTAADVIGSLR